MLSLILSRLTANLLFILARIFIPARYQERQQKVLAFNSTNKASSPWLRKAFISNSKLYFGASASTHRLFWLLFLFYGLGACSTQSARLDETATTPSLAMSYDAPEVFGTQMDLPSATELFQLKPEQAQDFKRFMTAQAQADLEPYQIVFKYLDRFSYRFRYSSRTLSAADSLSLMEGDCMSFAILTTALADLAGVVSAYQLMDTAPVFEQKGQFVVKGLHVRTKLYRSYRDSNDILRLSNGLIVDYFPGGERRFVANIQREQFLALYYRNQASEALSQKAFSEEVAFNQEEAISESKAFSQEEAISEEEALSQSKAFSQPNAISPINTISKENIQRAYWLMRKALELAPKDSDNLNNMALVMRHAGLEQKAEAIYLYGIELAEQKLSLLKNYRQLLLSQNRLAQAEQLKQQIKQLPDPNPYHWVGLANEALANQNFEDALSYYDKALELAPYLHSAYLGKAKVYSAMGFYPRALAALSRAAEVSVDAQQSEIYRAKLKSLKIKVLEFEQKQRAPAA